MTHPFVQVQNGVDLVLGKPEGELLVSESGCQGFCQMGPLVTVMPEGILYTRVKPGDVEEIIQTTLIGDEVVERLLYVDPVRGTHCKGTAQIPFAVLGGGLTSL